MVSFVQPYSILGKDKGGGNLIGTYTTYLSIRLPDVYLPTLKLPDKIKKKKKSNKAQYVLFKRVYLTLQSHIIEPAHRKLKKKKIEASVLYMERPFAFSEVNVRRRVTCCRM